MKRTVLVTGASGMLGSSVSTLLSGEKGLRVWNLSRKPVSHLQGQHVSIDLTRGDDLRNALSTIDPDCIIHCAANVNVDECEKYQNETTALHVDAVRSLVEFSAQRTRILYVSTDSVFDGRYGDYREEDETDPLNFYAKTKAQAEKIVRSFSDRTLVVRMNIYGFHHQGGNSLAEWALRNFREGKHINGFTDVMFNPLYVGQSARILAGLIAGNLTGVLHAGVRPALSKFSFLQKLAGKFGFSVDLVQEARMRDAHLKILRPMNTTLNLSRFEQLVGPAPSVNDGIAELERDYSILFARKDQK